jgi:hypothetical protein
MRVELVDVALQVNDQVKRAVMRKRAVALCFRNRKARRLDGASLELTQSFRVVIECYTNDSTGQPWAPCQQDELILRISRPPSRLLINLPPLLTSVCSIQLSWLFNL